MSELSKGWCPSPDGRAPTLRECRVALSPSPQHSVRARMARLLVTAFVLAAPLTTAGGQRAQPVAFAQKQLQRTAPGEFVALTLQSRFTSRSDSSSSARTRSVLSGTLWGAAIGSGVATITAFTITRRPHTDHTEDSLLYLLVPIGAIVGAEVGAALVVVVGSNR